MFLSENFPCSATLQTDTTMEISVIFFMIFVPHVYGANLCRY